MTPGVFFLFFLRLLCLDIPPSSAYLDLRLSARPVRNLAAESWPGVTALSSLGGTRDVGVFKMPPPSLPNLLIYWLGVPTKLGT